MTVVNKELPAISLFSRAGTPVAGIGLSALILKGKPPK
jgi:hypothetical protein